MDSWIAWWFLANPSMCCGLIFFGLIFLNQFKFFKLGWNFSNQIEIFKPVYFFWSSIYKKGKISLYIPLSNISYSHWVPLDLFYPPATLPFPQIPIKHEY